MPTVTRRILLLLSLAPGLAVAHNSPDHALSFVSGIAHPFGGLDHLLAMIGVGMLAAKLKERAVWLLPLVFITMLGVGATIGIGSTPSGLLEAILAASIVVLGLLLATKQTFDTVIAAIAIGSFALAHGYAHGAEAAANHASGYVLGVLLASALLHLAGIAIATTLARAKRDQGDTATRLAGLALAAAGVGILFS